MNVWTLSEAAERLQVSEDWYRAQLVSRKLPGHKIARKWRITDADLEAALEIFASPAIAATPANPWGQTKRSKQTPRR